MLNKILNGWRVVVVVWIIYQMVNNLIVLSNQARENQCADTIKIPLDIFESSTNAIRSNNPLSALTSALTSLVPFIVLYLAPFFEMLRNMFQYRIEGITSDGIVFWFLAWTNVILKNLWKEERPAAYKLCIRDKVSYGQPSGHAMWAVGIWTTSIILFSNLKPQKAKNEQLSRANTNVSLVYNSMFNVFKNKYLNIGWIISLSILWLFNIPFVRYDLQYHTILQIVSGMGFGIVGGCLWGYIFNRFPEASRYYWMRVLFCILFAVVKYLYSRSTIVILPLAFELLLWVYQWRSKEDPRNEYNNIEASDNIEMSVGAKKGGKDEEWDPEWSQSDEKAWQEAVLETPPKIFF